MLKRLFCLGPSGHEADAEWVVSNNQYLPSQGLYSAGKVLDIVEDEIEERYTAVDGKKRVALGPGSMRRLHRANLPIEDSQRATELLAKITAIDNARVASEKERARLANELAGAREDKRLAEFAQARAEQLAIARGEALYRCQERLTEAESQQVQLADVLKVTLDKLGMGLTPSPAPAPRGDRSPAQLVDRPAGLLFMQPPPAEGDVASPSRPDTPLSGFTVYSNELSDSPDAAWQARAADAGDAGDSATKWRDISDVAATCPSPIAATPAPVGVAPRAAGADPDAAAERLAQLIIPHLGAQQLESLARMGATMASPVLSSPVMQRHVVAAMQRARAEERQQQRASATEAPAPAPSAGPLSQAAGWSSPGLHGASHHMTTTFDPVAGARSTVTATAAGEPQFYGPFGAAAASVAASRDSIPSQPQEQRQALAQPPRKSTFRVMDKAAMTAAVGDRPLPPLPAARRSTDGGTIKAVMPEGRGAVAMEEGIPADDKFARQRRAAERLAQKLNSKLPPELRCSDPLGMQVPQAAVPQARPATSTTSSGGSSSGRRAPKGSLRRRAEQAVAMEVSSFNAAAAQSYRVAA